MKPLKKARKIGIWSVIFLVAFVYLNNSSLFVASRSQGPWLLAHRGLGQTFSMQGITSETNTAQRIYPPEHPYLENTIPSMAAAFRAGAAMVELDVHPTLDGQFAVFHDWILNYRTNGTGTTREHTMAELKTLDVGYGYSADNGKTFPFRGKGVGLMPSLTEVLERFPGRSFLIHVKSNDSNEGVLLAEFLKKLPPGRRAQLAVYGGDQPIAALKQRLPKLRVMSKAGAKKALIAYLAVGWTGYLPAGMRNTFLYLPLKYARLLWGWPHRFIKRLNDAHSQFAVVLGNGEWSEGFDTVASLRQLPPGYAGGIWTNRIDRIGAAVQRKKGDSSP